jgi:hypothetical protein
MAAAAMDLHLAIITKLFYIVWLKLDTNSKQSTI